MRLTRRQREKAAEPEPIAVREQTHEEFLEMFSLAISDEQVLLYGCEPRDEWQRELLRQHEAKKGKTR